MHSKTELQRFLSSAGIRPNRRLCQNFLIDLNLLKFLVEKADIKNNDIILEVGCGTASLTSMLAQKAGKVTAVEIDKALFDIAKSQLKHFENVELINADILRKKSLINPIVTECIGKVKPKYNGRFMLVANLPYNAAGPLMINLVANSEPIDAMYVTVQKEVAERITARPGSRDYGLLGILLNSTGNAKILKTIAPECFWPRPKVYSAFVSYQKDDEKIKKIGDRKFFIDIVKVFFQHRRKKLKSIVKFASNKLGWDLDWQQIFKSCKIDSNKRPDMLTENEYVNITNACSKNLI